MNFKKWLCIGLCIIIFFSFQESGFCASSGAFLIMDGRNGDILESENADAVLPMASTTKIMTALVVLNRVQLNETVKIPAEAVGTEGSSLYMKRDEVYTVEELLYGLMLRSANDCAEALAIYVGNGNRSAFIDEMNLEAERLGLKNTHFSNPSGLPEDQHHTTAAELALIMKKAMENPIFRTIVATKTYTLKGNTIVNHNRLLSMCEGCIGGKTGYTMAAGRCLVSVSERNGVPLICVTLGRRDDWNIHCFAYDRWFGKLTEKVLLEPNSYSVPLKTPGGEKVEAVNIHQVSVKIFEGKTQMERHIYADPFLYGDKEKGAVAGTVVFCSNGVILGESPMVLKSEITVPIEKDLLISRIFRFFRRLFLKNQ